VGANEDLRARLRTEAEARGASVFFPPVELCTDNGAMIAFAAALKHGAGVKPRGDAFPVFPRWDLADA
jgi:N6-L-threonylcarbamoyladenine synthase